MFKSVSLYTNKIKELKRFYMNVLEMTIDHSKGDSFTVHIGTSELTFKQSDGPCFYHYAINYKCQDKNVHL